MPQRPCSPCVVISGAAGGRVSRSPATCALLTQLTHPLAHGPAAPNPQPPAPGPKLANVQSITEVHTSFTTVLFFLYFLPGNAKRGSCSSEFETDTTRMVRALPAAPPAGGATPGGLRTLSAPVLQLLLLLGACAAVQPDCGCPRPAASEALVAAWLASPAVGVGPHLLASLREMRWQVRLQACAAERVRCLPGHPRFG